MVWVGVIDGVTVFVGVLVAVIVGVIDGVNEIVGDWVGVGVGVGQLTIHGSVDTVILTYGSDGFKQIVTPDV